MEEVPATMDGKATRRMPDKAKGEGRPEAKGGAPQVNNAESFSLGGTAGSPPHRQMDWWNGTCQ